MRSIVLARELFDKLKAPASGDSSPIANRQWLTRAFTDLTEALKADVTSVIADAIRSLGAVRNPVDEIQQVFAYEESLVHYNLFLLWWVWQNGVELTDAEQSEIVRAANEAMLGYRLIDLFIDHGKLGAETIAFGTYLIRSHERRLIDVFGPGSLPVLGAYADEYARAEYLEKSHRRQACPYAWDDATRIGSKAAPAFAIFHLLFARAGKSDAEISELVAGLRLVFAGLQMCDDLTDVADDLANGFETLAASGFRKIDDVPTWRTVPLGGPLGQVGLRLYFRTTLDLWNAATTIFTDQEDTILLLLAEYRKSQFLGQWEASERAAQHLTTFNEFLGTGDHDESQSTRRVEPDALLDTDAEQNSRTTVGTGTRPLG